MQEIISIRPRDIRVWKDEALVGLYAAFAAGLVASLCGGRPGIVIGAGL